MEAERFAASWSPGTVSSMRWQAVAPAGLDRTSGRTSDGWDINVEQVGR